jgi:phosphotriesterase-related protein
MGSMINTVTGPISPDELGRTLMHEHVFVEYGTAMQDNRSLGAARPQILATCLDFANQVRACGVATVVDPTTTDLGRNIPLLVALAEQADLQIVCCTGIYSTSTYQNLRLQLGGGPDAITDLFIKELTEGIGDSGVKAGIIKLVSGHEIDDDDHELLTCCARASVATGTPIITHTEGVLGPKQQEILHGAGVPLEKIIVGHSCISTNFSYHQQIAQAGSYIGFDRFGMEGGMPDEVRVESLKKLIDAGFLDKLIVSHDSVWYWVNGPAIGQGPYKNWKPTNFFERVMPILTYSGVSESQIETMLTDNPRRFFS